MYLLQEMLQPFFKRSKTFTKILSYILEKLFLRLTFGHYLLFKNISLSAKLGSGCSQVFYGQLFLQIAQNSQKACRSVTLIKSITGVFVCILSNFPEKLFYGTSLGCFFLKLLPKACFTGKIWTFFPAAILRKNAVPLVPKKFFLFISYSMLCI